MIDREAFASVISLSVGGPTKTLTMFLVSCELLCLSGADLVV